MIEIKVTCNGELAPVLNSSVQIGLVNDRATHYQIDLSVPNGLYVSEIILVKKDERK